jgi:trigger factor
MKISSEPMENRQIALNVEMETAEVDGYMEKAYRSMVGKVTVPGFRKGKTPRSVFERHVGRERLFQEALEVLIPDAYEKAVIDQKIEPIARPEIELVKTEPVVFKAIVPVKPEIEIGDYKSVRVEKEAVDIKDTDVEAAVDQMRQQHATQVPVENRAVENGDIVVMDMEGESEGKPVAQRKDIPYEVVKDSPFPLPGFADNIIGINKDEEKDIELSYPEDYTVKELAGKSYKYKVKVKEIKRKVLPEANDDFAKTVESESMDDLRTKIQLTLKNNAEQKVTAEFEQQVLDKIAEVSKIDYPPVMVENEISKIVNEEARIFPQGIAGLENYLKGIGKDFETHKEELKPEAIKRIEGSLILSKIAEVENITADDQEITEEIEKMLQNQTQNVEEMRNFFNTEEAKNSVKQFIKTRKTIDMVKEIASGEKK